jgi:hypothetical protein
MDDISFKVRDAIIKAFPASSEEWTTMLSSGEIINPSAF